MGSHLKDSSVENQEKHFEWRMIVVKCMMWLSSFLVSLTGGLLLTWWETEFHPTNSQLWMLPFGLILFCTPIIVWFAVVLSDLCEPCECCASQPPSCPSCTTASFAVQNYDPEK